MTSLLSPRHFAVGIAMLLAVGLSMAIDKPRAGGANAPNLKALIPERFGDWRVDTSMAPVVPNPELEATLAKVYSDTLNRTYVNSAGQRVMLSVAYTGDIDRGMDVHRPEVCYPAQGFELVSHPRADVLSLAATSIPVRRLVARQGARVEPISYWITVGEAATSQGWQRKLMKLRYALTGQVPDGMLVRVSTIGIDAAAAFKEQDRFLESLAAEMSEEDRKRLIGNLRL
jgi:EpsI family protein